MGLRAEPSGDHGLTVSITVSPANIIGSVSIQFLLSTDGFPKTAEFGTLTVMPSYRSSGLGRRSIDFAEATAREKGCKTMQLEPLLLSLIRTHPEKDFLKKWYGKLGYRQAGRGSVEKRYPHLVKHLNGLSDFEIMQKELS